VQRKKERQAMNRKAMSRKAEKTQRGKIAEAVDAADDEGGESTVFWVDGACYAVLVDGMGLNTFCCYDDEEVRQIWFPLEALHVLRDALKGFEIEE